MIYLVLRTLTAEKRREIKYIFSTGVISGPFQIVGGSGFTLFLTINWSCQEVLSCYCLHTLESTYKATIAPGLVTNSIIFLYFLQSMIKVKKCVFTRDISRFVSAYMMSWDLRAYCATPYGVVISLKFWNQHTRQG